ncbi:GNAT family N-acetyltransferase [Pleurocapsales cyanobacterium LEGE 06147]|nr:GNAT family N-acetyltransferase [Pleurocapsales cyanobacterium LEGE 06147]
MGGRKSEVFSGLIPSEPSDRSNNAHYQNIIIRPVELKDLRSLAEILVYSFYDFPQLLSWVYPLLRLSIYEDLRSRLRSHPPLYCCLVASLVSAESEPTIVGTVELTMRFSSFSWIPEAQYPYISNLAVKNTYRRQGIGRKLLLRCEQLAREWGYREIRLHVLENNHSAKQLYFSNGYQLYQQDSSWSEFFLNGAQRLLLRKKLSPISQ